MTWIYKVTEREVNPLKLGRKYCFYCRSALDSAIRISTSDSAKEVKVCRICGWWWLLEIEDWGAGHFMWKGSYANLKELDLTNIDQPIDEVKKYLIAKYEKRFDLSWQLYEDVVRSVFKDLGYVVVCYGRQKDGGLDAILSRHGKGEIGVQIKKYKNKIAVSQIRELVGALVENGITNGAFVTTARFTRDVKKLSTVLQSSGFPIELYDAEKFYEALRISRTERALSKSEWQKLIESAETVEFDSKGFWGSNEDKERYARAYFEKSENKIKKLMNKVILAKVCLRHNSYVGKYIYDDILKLYIGIASRSDLPDITFYFENEDEARDSFVGAVDMFCAKFMFLHRLNEALQTNNGVKP